LDGDRPQGVLDLVGDVAHGRIDCAGLGQQRQSLSPLIRDVGLPLVPLPPYAPERNPAERSKAGLPRPRGHRRAADALVAELVVDPERVRRLAGWDCIMMTVDALLTVGE
jgi:hypothetical protein